MNGWMGIACVYCPSQRQWKRISQGIWIFKQYHRVLGENKILGRRMDYIELWVFFTLKNFFSKNFLYNACCELNSRE